MILGSFEKLHFSIKNCCVYFWGNFWEKLGYILVQHLVALSILKYNWLSILARQFPTPECICSLLSVIRPGHKWWTSKRYTNLVGDHCILRPTFNKLSPPPISDAFDNREYFFCIIQMIQLWHYLEIVCSITIKKIFFIVIKSTLNGGMRARALV